MCSNDEDFTAQAEARAERAEYLMKQWKRRALDAAVDIKTWESLARSARKDADVAEAELAAIYDEGLVPVLQEQIKELKRTIEWYQDKV